MKIAILEDNRDRLKAMKECVLDRFCTFETHFFRDTAAMLRFLKDHLAECLVISLDNDLDPIPGPGGLMIEAGEGRQIAEFLAAHSPVCPVIIHTSNGPAADSMTATLQDAGWKIRRVIPFEDTSWIRDDWFPALRRILVGPVRTTIPDAPLPQPEATSRV